MPARDREDRDVEGLRPAADGSRPRPAGSFVAIATGSGACQVVRRSRAEDDWDRAPAPDRIFPWTEPRLVEHPSEAGE